MNNCDTVRSKVIAPDASHSRQQPSLNLAIVEGCKLHGINNQKLQEFLSSSLSIKISDERNIRRQASKLVQQFMKHSILKYWIIHEVHWKDQVIHESFTRFSKARRPTWHSSGSSSRRQRRISFPGGRGDFPVSQSHRRCRLSLSICVLAFSTSFLCVHGSGSFHSIHITRLKTAPLVLLHRPFVRADSELPPFISSSALPDLESDMARFQVMFTYFGETVYDLAMSPDKNISSNMGFEKVAGIINNRHD